MAAVISAWPHAACTWQDCGPTWRDGARHTCLGSCAVVTVVRIVRSTIQPLLGVADAEQVAASRADSDMVRMGLTPLKMLGSGTEGPTWAILDDRIRRVPFHPFQSPVNHVALPSCDDAWIGQTSRYIGWYCYF